MPTELISPPLPEEYAPHFALYVAKVPEPNVMDALESNLDELSLLGSVPDAEAGHRYAPGKWSIREVAGHLIDAERVFAYRLLRIARTDPTPLSPFDQDLWVPASGANGRSVASLLLEFASVRASTVQLVDSLSADAWTRLGTASGKTISVRALAWVCAGHELHHVRIIREKYLRS